MDSSATWHIIGNRELFKSVNPIAQNSSITLVRGKGYIEFVTPFGEIEQVSYIIYVLSFCVKILFQ